jgi:alpha-glucosidase
MNKHRRTLCRSFLTWLSSTTRKMLSATRMCCFLYTILVAVQLGATSIDIGAVRTIRNTDNVVLGTTESAKFRIIAYSDHVIRVRITQSNSFREFSYMLEDCELPDYKGAAIVQDSDKVTLTTPAMRVIIDKSPVLRVIFQDLDGRVLNEDEPGRGFATSFLNGKVTSYKHLQEGERFIGLGEALGNLDRRGSVVTLRNTDTFKYDDNRLPMYPSIPFYIGLHNNLCYGLFYHNSYAGTFNFGAGNNRFMSITHEGGDVDYFFIYDASPAKILNHYVDLTGHSTLPPMWSLGYHQSRCSYYPQERALEIAKTFRAHRIPIDCLVLDADYLNKYQPFRIDTKRFPDMKALTSELKRMNIEVTASVNPGIAVDSDYLLNRSALKEGVLLKYIDGTNYVAPIAPNTNYFVDYTLPKGRAWWIRQMKLMPDLGIMGTWNDMNEPAVSESALPENVVFNFDSHGSNGGECRNLFGMLVARSSYEAGLKNNHGERPFVLTRSATAGIQRYAAIWTGDNTANSEHLLKGTLLNTQLGLSGVPFTGYDIGGFIGDGSKELFQRWIQAGVFSTFMRTHRIYFGAANEPWSFGEETEVLARNYIGLRYRLMPYIYSTFYESTINGMPLTRSLSFGFPYDSSVYDTRYQYQFLFGNALLVMPITPEEKVKDEYFPHGVWYDFFTDDIIEGSQQRLESVPNFKMPVFVRASSIIPVQSLVQSTSEQPSDTLFVHVYFGTKKNQFDYYEDDGRTFEYQKGSSLKKRISYDPKTKTITFGSKEGKFNSRYRKICLVFHGFSLHDTVQINGKEKPIEKGFRRLFDPLEGMVDYYDEGFLADAYGKIPAPRVAYITFDNSDRTIHIAY